MWQEQQNSIARFSSPVKIGPPHRGSLLHADGYGGLLQDRGQRNGPHFTQFVQCFPAGCGLGVAVHLFDKQQKRHYGSNALRDQRGPWVSFSAVHPELMPQPVSVFNRFIRTFTKPIGKINLLGHAWASLQRVLLALLFSWTFGIAFGILIGWNRSCRAIFGSIFEVIRPIPPIAC